MSSSTTALAAFLSLAAGAILALPAAGNGDPISLDSNRVLGEGEVEVGAQAPTLLVRDGRLPGNVEVIGGNVTVEHIDDRQKIVRANTPPKSVDVVSYHERNRTEHDHPGFERAKLLSFTDADATVVVQPLQPSVELSLRHEGLYEAEPVEDELLENSHYLAEDATQSPLYYEYRASEELGLRLDGTSHLQVEGTFEVYIWGGLAEVVDRNGTEVYDTGHSVEEESQGTRTVTEEHYEFVRMTVETGRLTMETRDAEEMAVFAQRMEADVAPGGLVTFEDAEGLLGGPEGLYEAEGEALAATDGDYRWSYGGEDLSAATLAAPASVEGGQPVSDDGLGPDWLLWTSLAAILAGTVASARHAVPPYLDEARAWLRERRVQRWMKTGDRLTSVRDYEAALSYYQRITERYPEISEAWYSQGVVLQELDRHEAAAEAFVEAHASIQEEEPELLDMAAAQAWRAGDEPKVRELFEHLAIVDPVRLRRRLQEPEFAELRGAEWVRELFDDDGDGMQYA